VKIRNPDRTTERKSDVMARRKLNIDQSSARSGRPKRSL
jgi:hypothetical protein